MSMSHGLLEAQSILQSSHTELRLCVNIHVSPEENKLQVVVIAITSRTQKQSLCAIFTVSHFN